MIDKDSQHQLFDPVPTNTHMYTLKTTHPNTHTQGYVMYAQIKSNLYSHTTLSIPALRLHPTHLPKRSSLCIGPSEIPHLHMCLLQPVFSLKI